MTKPVNIREICLEILQEITEEEAYSHIVLREVLEKYQYLEKRDRAFISRVVEGTLEHMIQLDYIIEQFSNVPVYNMKPLIRNLLRMSVYQLKYMDSVPDSAACNEAVKLAQRKGFYNLKGFVNGVLRSTARRLSQVRYPDPAKEPLHYLSVKYSFPVWMLEKWVTQYGYEVTEKICLDSHMEKGTVVRCNLQKASKEEIIASLTQEGIRVRQHPYLDYALILSDYNYMRAIAAFKNGWIQVQDISSMLVAEIAAPNWGEYCIDVCAAPGGKALHIAEKLMGSGYVEARDISEYKVQLMQENIERTDAINIRAAVKDATVVDEESIRKADIVLADVPCSGLGVIGRKPDIKYYASKEKEEELVRIQRAVLANAASYVKPGGTLLYSTCTVNRKENSENAAWFLEQFPFEAVSLDELLPDELKSGETAKGQLQLIPGVHKTDGFFLAKFRKTEEGRA